jgi:hypothetical protein
MAQKVGRGYRRAEAGLPQRTQDSLLRHSDSPRRSEAKTGAPANASRLSLNRNLSGLFHAVARRNLATSRNQSGWNAEHRLGPLRFREKTKTTRTKI